MYRTHNNGKLRLTNVNQEVTLCGWVSKRRNFGALVFIDLRDRYGITQLGDPLYFSGVPFGVFRKYT